MIDQINILYYSNSARLVSELNDKLIKGGWKTNTCELNEEHPFAANHLKSSCVNVLIAHQEDMKQLEAVTWSSFQNVNTQRKNVAFCIDCNYIIPQLEKIYDIKKTIDSAEVIRREIILLYNHLFQKSKKRFGFFVGRNKEIEQFQSLFFSEKSSRINAMVVSGRPGVGREAYVRECIRQQSKGNENYEPFTLSMGKNGNIELFLVQLNSILQTFSEEVVIELLKGSSDSKVDNVVKMLNDLFSDDNYLLLYDDGCSCVRYDRCLSEWFEKVISHPMLKGGMHLYVISNISISYSRIEIGDGVAFITLYGLTMSDRKKLLYRQLSEHSMSLPEEFVHFLADKLVFSPSQLMKVVDDIENKGEEFVRKNIGNYQIVGDNKIRSLVISYDTDDHPEAKNILVLLSKIEFLSEKNLKSVLSVSDEEVEKELDRFMADGIVERFGEMMNLIRLDSSISDYLRRNKVRYNQDYIQNDVNDRLAKIISNSTRITEDYSAFLERLKQGLKQSRINDESLLIPSVLVNSIAESYNNPETHNNERNWNKTIELCEMVLEKKTTYFEEVYKEINYWYCLALAREQKRDEFYDKVRMFSGADLLFLKGFYLRIGKQYAKAEEEYNKALRVNPNFSKAKQELVLVLQKQQKYATALQMAQLNYEKNPENAYFIHAYFRCLVRKPEIKPDELSLLKKFKEDKDNFFMLKHFTDGMKFEYMRFIDRAKPEILFHKAQELTQKYNGIAYIQDIVDEFYVSQGVKSHLKPIDNSDEFNF